LAALKVVVYVVGYGSAFLLLAGAILLLFFGDIFSIQNARNDGYLLLALGITVLAIDIGLTVLLRREE
jgi:hypothetical protein